MGSSVAIRTGRFPVQTPLGAQPDLETQPHHKAPIDLWVKIVQTQWLTLGEWGCPLNNGPKLAAGQSNWS